jgi:hypothetical protein
MMNPDTTAVHYHSHAALLTQYRPGGRLLDAIIVSTCRSADSLGPTFKLGATLGVPVAALCSGEARLEGVLAVAGRYGTDVIVLDFAGMKELPFIRLETATASVGRQVGSHGDLGVKRTTGLILGRLAGWRSVLFLDDDIDDLDPAMVIKAVGGLDHHTAVGMPALWFPDNSAVCHAYRLGVGEHEVFVSGSAVAVDLHSADSFFPNIYNEDWLFLVPHLDRRKVTSFGHVRQKEYAPFADPRRLEMQEFGDVLAEGLVSYLHSMQLRNGPYIDYWEAFLERRAELILLARRGCATLAEEDAGARAALVALDVAENARSKISAVQLADYVELWIGDLARWRRFLVGVPRLGDLRESILWLNIPALIVLDGRRLPSDMQDEPLPDPAQPYRERLFRKRI